METVVDRPSCVAGLLGGLLEGKGELVITMVSSTASPFSQSANFSFDSGRNDKIPSPPYIPPDIMGLFSNAPRLAEMDGKKMSLPWYQGNYLNKQEQFISTVISQGVGQCLAEVAALVNGARLSLSVTQVDSRNAVIRRADTTDRFTNDASC